MPRPRKRRRLRGNPKSVFYKPQGVPLRSLEIKEISLEEFEALRLRYVKKINQNQCAKEMQTSQSTFQRILTHALEMVSQAIVEGKAIKIKVTNNKR